jgi:hypothetical protein
VARNLEFVKLVEGALDADLSGAKDDRHGLGFHLDDSTQAEAVMVDALFHGELLDSDPLGLLRRP